MNDSAAKAIEDSFPAGGRVTHVRLVVLGFLCAAAALAYLQRNCLATAESTMSADLGLTKQQMGTVFSSFFFGYAFFQVPGGWVSKRWGARFALPFFALLWSAGMVAGVVSGTAIFASGLHRLGLVAGSSTGELAAAQVSFYWLLVARFVAGIGQAGLFPCAAEVISRWFPTTRRAVASGWLAGFMQVGGIVANLLTGTLLKNEVNWRVIFCAFTLPSLAWAVWFYFWFRESPSEHPGVSAGELALLPGAGKAVAGGSSTPWIELLTSPAMWWICGQQIFRAGGYIFFATWFATYLQEAHGVTIQKSGWLGSLPLLGVLLSAPVGGWLSDMVLEWSGSRRASRCGLGVVFMVTCAALIFASQHLAMPLAAVLLISLGAFCSGIVGAPAYAVAIEMGDKHVTMVFACFNMAGNLGAAVFPLIVPLLLRQSGGNWDVVLYVFGGIYVVGAACWLLLDPRGSIFDQALVRPNKRPSP